MEVSEPADSDAAERALYPSETTFSDLPDARDMLAFVPGSQNWSSEHNPRQVARDMDPDYRRVFETLQSFMGRTDAKCEVLANKVKVLESITQGILSNMRAGRR